MGARTELRIAPFAAVLLLGMLLCDGSGIFASTLLAAFLHECGHLLAARLMHISFERVRLGLLGVRLDIRGQMLSYSQEWLLAAAGPFASLLAAALASFFWNSSVMARQFSCASLVLGVLNLLPIRTFDGGRMLESALSAVCSVRTVRRVMEGSSFLFLLFLWGTAVYFLLRAADGLSLLCFSMSLFFRFFDEESM